MWWTNQLLRQLNTNYLIAISSACHLAELLRCEVCAWHWLQLCYVTYKLFFHWAVYLWEGSPGKRGIAYDKPYCWPGCRYHFTRSDNLLVKGWQPRQNRQVSTTFGSKIKIGYVCKKCNFYGNQMICPLPLFAELCAITMERWVYSRMTRYRHTTGNCSNANSQ